MVSLLKSNLDPDPTPPAAFRFANVFVYYGLSLNISDFGMNIYLTQMIFGLVEMPARTITLFTLNRSRKISQLAFLAVGGMACLLTIFIPAGEEPAGLQSLGQPHQVVRREIAALCHSACRS